MPTLTYFDFPGGRGEDCRLALHIAGVDFIDDRVKRGMWVERKPNTPWGSLPVYEEDGRILGQSNAILFYLGQKHGLLPTDPWEAARHLAVMAAVEDLRHAIQLNSGTDAPSKKVARDTFRDGGLRAWCRQVSAQVQGPFVGGEKLGVADLKLFVVLKWFMTGGVDHIPGEAFGDYAKLVTLYEAVKAHPGVVSWYAKTA